VRTVTCTGPRTLSASAARGALRPRRWVERPGYRGLGRYVPDTCGAAASDFEATSMVVFKKKGDERGGCSCCAVM